MADYLTSSDMAMRVSLAELKEFSDDDADDAINLDIVDQALAAGEKRVGGFYHRRYGSVSGTVMFKDFALLYAEYRLRMRGREGAVPVDLKDEYHAVFGPSGMLAQLASGHVDDPDMSGDTIRTMGHGMIYHAPDDETESEMDEYLEDPESG